MSTLTLISDSPIRASVIAEVLGITDARIRCTTNRTSSHTVPDSPAWYVARINGPWEEEEVKHARSILLERFAAATTVIVPDALAVDPPKLVVTDVDATLITEEVIEELARHAGHFEEVQAITASAMNGEIDFDRSLHLRVATLKGLPQSVLNQVALSVHVRDGVEDFINGVHRCGGRFGVVSGGFSQVLAPLAQRLKLDFYLANDLEVEAGVLTGRINGDIVNPHAKVQAFHQWLHTVGSTWLHTVAMGDGANDLPFMEEAGLAVAFCAKPAVRTQIPDQVMVPSFAPMLPILGI